MVIIRENPYGWITCMYALAWLHQCIPFFNIVFLKDDLTLSCELPKSGWIRPCRKSKYNSTFKRYMCGVHMHTAVSLSTIGDLEVFVQSELALAGWKVRIGLDWSIKNLELDTLNPKYYARLSSLGLHLLLVYSWLTGTIGIQSVSKCDKCKPKCHFLWPFPFLCKMFLTLPSN